MGVEKIKQVVCVLSGKGGVGKSTVACQLGFQLCEMGYSVGMLDVDICGPSMPIILGLNGKEVTQTDGGWTPVPVDGTDGKMVAMSIAFLINDPKAAVVWRGPRKTALINQFLKDVNWGSLDFLVIDTPPGTSDEHMSVIEGLKGGEVPLTTLLVSTPQQVAIDDVRKELTFVRKCGIPCLGLVENMSGFVCGHCSTTTNIFGSNGTATFAQQEGLEVLTKIPLDPELAAYEDEGKPYLVAFKESAVAACLKSLAEKVVKKTIKQPA